MSEEIRNPGMEMSDVELADVSGAGDSKAIIARARSVCLACASIGGHCRGNQIRSLGKYLEANGISSVRKPEECPYYWQ